MLRWKGLPARDVDHGVRLLVRVSHVHVAHGTARQVRGVHGGRVHGVPGRVQRVVHGVLVRLRRLLAASHIVFVRSCQKNLC